LKIGLLPSKKRNLKRINESEDGAIFCRKSESCDLCGK
jgi:hypothetical protein